MTSANKYADASPGPERDAAMNACRAALAKMEKIIGEGRASMFTADDGTSLVKMAENVRKVMAGTFYVNMPGPTPTNYLRSWAERAEGMLASPRPSNVVPIKRPAGGVADELGVGHAPAQSAKAPADEDTRFEGLTVAQYVLRPPPEWIVEGILPQTEELSYIIGDWGTGKSFLALDMAGAVAQGVPWRGRDVKRMRVIYVAAEGAGGFRNRLVAYCQHHGIEPQDLDIIVIPAAPHMLKPNDVTALLAKIRQHGPAGWIIIDTLARVTSGANENSAEDMSLLIVNCKKVSQATKAHVTLVHHEGKDALKGGRGWSGMEGAADAQIRLSGKQGLRTATTRKMKEGEDNIRMQFRLAVVEIGKDAKGKPITSCVVQHDQRSEGTGHKADTREPTSKWQKFVWQAFKDLTETIDSTTMEAVVNLALERVPRDKDEIRDRRKDRLKDALIALTADGRWIRQEHTAGGHGRLVRVQSPK